MGDKAVQASDPEREIQYQKRRGILLPYYWNIAPNFDATITPHYMNKRGGVM
ncbi:hypothetical protein MJ561_04985 [Klebsiella pneumoniae]|nr:hypothetical protein MJ561_04985 [Klebsiella pneumoniae]